MMVKSMMDINLDEILSKFNIESGIKKYGNGHINSTYCTGAPKCILQRINTTVFKNPYELMENIENVTNYIRKKVEERGGNPDRETLTVIKAVDGKNLYKADDENYFRVYKFIDGTKTVEDDKTYDDLYNAGVGFGRFQNMLDDFPTEILHDTIVDFHNTPKRVEALKKAIEEDKAGRAAEVKDEIEFALECASFADVVTSKIESGEIPVRVTHNDTKINNILFDEKSGEAVAVIDLDTVMPGSALYDFGDTLRMGASTAAEDEADLSIVNFDIDAFEAFARGFLSETKDVLNKTEIELLPFSAKLLTYECGIRFLTDYLDGDVYFKTHRPGHNLDRARNQFKLVKEMAENEEKMSAVIKKIVG